MYYHRPEDIEKVLLIKAFLDKHFREAYNYAYLIKKFAINKFKLMITFKYVTSDTIHQYVTKVRIHYAQKLLQTTKLTIAYIAAEVGLDKSNFNIQFKQITGKTPSSWRKEHRINIQDILLEGGSNHVDQ